MEFSICCAVYRNRGINANSLLSVEKVRERICKRLFQTWNKLFCINYGFFRKTKKSLNA